MDEVWVPLLSALLGGVIASIASIASIILQSRFQAKRERGRLIMEASIQEHKTYVDLAKVIPGKKRIYPLSTFLITNANLLKLLEKDALTPENLRNLHKKMEEIMKVYDESLEDQQQETPPPTQKPG
jgi:hypothetical protein